MSKLRAILFACVAASVTASVTGCFGSCFFATDCDNPDEKLPAYANKSGKMVKIIAIAEGYPPYEKYIANGDTLYNYPTEEWNVLFLIGCESDYCRDDTLARVKLHFLDDPQKCLIFDGPIRHDSIDIRSLESYKKGEKKLDNITTYYAAYIYTITPEHRAMAKEEDCQSSASD